MSVEYIFKCEVNIDIIHKYEALIFPQNESLIIIKRISFQVCFFFETNRISKYTTNNTIILVTMLKNE